MSIKILVITPKFPFPKTGACEQDRGYGIEELINLGFDVRVISKISPEKIFQGAVETKRLGIKITVIPYTKKDSRNSLSEILRRLFSPKTWDGAANEYNDPKFKEAVVEELDEFKPNLVWFDYTYLWPLYKLVIQKNIPIITRSVNFEPNHFIQEDGFTLLSIFKYFAKLTSEYIVVQKSDLLFSIAPKEEEIYKMMGAKVVNLPLRGLPRLIADSREIKKTKPLNVFFLGSTYNVKHNLKALEFLLKEIIPRVKEKDPNGFVFHILGSKMPDKMKAYFAENVVYHGYIENLDDFLKDMDIAVIPSIMGAGMQQKVFEPLVRGIPSVISPRGISGYSFVPQRDYLPAKTANEFAESILSLKDEEKRRQLSENSLKKSRQIFAKEMINNTILKEIKSLTENKTT